MMRTMRRWAVGLFMATLVLQVCSATNSRPASARSSSRQELLDPVAHNGTPDASAFVPIRQSGMEAMCGTFLPPRLVTVGGTLAGDHDIAVDVVVGRDGAVESVLLLDDAGAVTQTKIADRISRWVYKPALCNGIPVASEGRIEIRAE